MLAKGATAPDVATLLGDTADTIEKHYAPFVKELRERARQLMENREGIEKLDCTFIAQQTRPDSRDPMKTLDNKNFTGGRACKPETSRILVDSMSYVESANATRQRSQS